MKVYISLFIVLSLTSASCTRSIKPEDEVYYVFQTDNNVIFCSDNTREMKILKKPIEISELRNNGIPSYIRVKESDRFKVIRYVNGKINNISGISDLNLTYIIWSTFLILLISVKCTHDLIRKRVSNKSQ